MGAKNIYYQFVKTRIGDIVIVWQEQGIKPKIIKIILPKLSRNYLEKKYPSIMPGRNKTIDKVASAIKNYISGKKIKFKFTIKFIDLQRLKHFQKKVLSLTNSIPRGRVESYGSIAKKLGIPKGARAVGQALAYNPFPIIIPCHRVIKSDGSIGGFGGNIDLKRKLLKIEGVCVK